MTGSDLPPPEAKKKISYLKPASVIADMGLHKVLI